MINSSSFLIVFRSLIIGFKVMNIGAARDFFNMSRGFTGKGKVIQRAFNTQNLIEEISVFCI